VWFGSWDAEADAEAAKARFNKEEERLWENRERKWQHDNQAESAIVVKYEEKMRRQQESRDAAGIAAKHEALQKRVSAFAALAFNSARLVHLKGCLHQGE